MENRVEQIEFLRERACVSYEEALELLNKYNGDITQALIELEKNGRVYGSPKIKFDKFGDEGKKFADKTKKLFDKSMENRVIIKKDDRTIVDSPSLFAVVATLAAPHVVGVGAALGLLNGYKIKFSKDGKEEKDLKVALLEMKDSFENKVKECKDECNKKDDK